MTNSVTLCHNDLLANCNSRLLYHKPNSGNFCEVAVFLGLSVGKIPHESILVHTYEFTLMVCLTSSSLFQPNENSLWFPPFPSSPSLWRLLFPQTLLCGRSHSRQRAHTLLKQICRERTLKTQYWSTHSLKTKHSQILHAKLFFQR